MILVIMGDNHLKPYLFDDAEMLMKEYGADATVCLGDMADDWHKQYSLEAYRDTYDAAIAYARKYPNTIFIYGNHDICYEWNERETGYSKIAPRLVVEKLQELRDVLPENNQPSFVRRVDNVLISHGGICDFYIYDLLQRKGLPVSMYDDTDGLIEIINALGPELWYDISPLWYRPQYSEGKMYKDDCMLQVVGHTPVAKPFLKGSILSCDTFSTESDGTPIGTQEFVVIDTETWEWHAVKRKALKINGG